MGNHTPLAISQLNGFIANFGGRSYTLLAFSVRCAFPIYYTLALNAEDAYERQHSPTNKSKLLLALEIFSCSILSIQTIYVIGNGIQNKIWLKLFVCNNFRISSLQKSAQCTSRYTSKTFTNPLTLHSPHCSA